METTKVLRFSQKSQEFDWDNSITVKKDFEIVTHHCTWNELVLFKLFLTNENYLHSTSNRFTTQCVLNKFNEWSCFYTRLISEGYKIVEA